VTVAVQFGYCPLLMIDMSFALRNYPLGLDQMFKRHISIHAVLPTRFINTMKAERIGFDLPQKMKSQHGTSRRFLIISRALLL